MEIADSHPRYIFTCPDCDTRTEDESPTAIPPGVRARLRKPVRDEEYVWARRVKRYVNTTGEMFKARRREIVGLTRKGDVALDIGVGPGIILPQLGQRCGPGGLVVALDISTRVLAEARRNASDPSRIPETCKIEGLSEKECEKELTITAHPDCPLVYVRGDAEHLPLAPRVVDFAYGSISLNYTNLETSIPEIARVLRGGGRAYVSLPSWSTRWALEMLSMPAEFCQGFPDWFMPDLAAKVRRHFESFAEWFGKEYPEQLQLSEMGWTWHEHPLFYYISWKEGEIGEEEFGARVKAWEERVSGSHDDEKVSIHPPPQRFTETIIDLANQLGLVVDMIKSTPEIPRKIDSKIKNLPSMERMFWIAHTNLRRENLAILRSPECQTQ